MEEYEIWAEGYIATGEHQPAVFYGKRYGNSFEEACHSFFKNHENWKLFDPARMTVWGCRLFNNETDARKAFG